MVAVLASFGLEVRAASSCAEARAMLDGPRVDALVTDFSLGDGDAIALLLGLGSRRPQLAILVTGHGSLEHRARSKLAGFDAHLEKPILLEDLEAALRPLFAQVAATS